ncbi:hypothetical protein STRDD11_00490 [Streptococcus sp. DD11]|nr:hypothetical protein STRDD11_00490 [Streptococcus sp. DD11]
MPFLSVTSKSLSHRHLSKKSIKTAAYSPPLQSSTDSEGVLLPKNDSKKD